MKFTAIVGLLTLVLSGCSLLSSEGNSSADDKDGEEKKKNVAAVLTVFEPEATLTRLWSTSVVGDYEPMSKGLHPSLHDGVIFAADADGRVAAVDAETGKRLWSVHVDEETLGGGVGAGGDLVAVGSLSGKVIALDAKTGEKRWDAQVSSEVLGSPGVNSAVVAVMTLDGRMVAFSPEDGSKQWQVEQTVPVLTLRGTGAPVVKHDMVVAGFANGKVLAVDPYTGGLVWENRIAIPQGRTELERMVDIDGTPIVTDDAVYAVSYQGRVGAIERTNGRGMWYQSSSSFVSPAFGAAQVFVAEKGDIIKAYGASGGQELWSNEKLANRYLSAPVVVGDYLAVGDGAGYLHILSPIDGRFVARTRIDSAGIRVPMIASGNILYIQDADGGLSAYRVE